MRACFFCFVPPGLVLSQKMPKRQHLDGTLRDVSRTSTITFLRPISSFPALSSLKQKFKPQPLCSHSSFPFFGCFFLLLVAASSHSLLRPPSRCRLFPLLKHGAFHPPHSPPPPAHTSPAPFAPSPPSR